LNKYFRILIILSIDMNLGGLSMIGWKVGLDIWTCLVIHWFIL